MAKLVLLKNEKRIKMCLAVAYKVYAVTKEANHAKSQNSISRRNFIFANTC